MNVMATQILPIVSKTVAPSRHMISNLEKKIHIKCFLKTQKHMQQVKLCSKIRPLRRGKKKKKEEKKTNTQASSSVSNLCYKYHQGITNTITNTIMYGRGKDGCEESRDLHLHKSWSRPAQTWP